MLAGDAGRPTTGRCLHRHWLADVPLGHDLYLGAPCSRIDVSFSQRADDQPRHQGQPIKAVQSEHDNVR